MNVINIANQFKTEEDAIAYLEQIRWSKGVRCATCGCDKITKIKSTSKKQAVRHLYQCGEATCRQQFTVKSGTLFHDSHLPLQKWFMAMALICEAKKGISANQLGRTIGVQYKTAWYMAHRISEAMKNNKGNPLGGVVEVDETFMGGRGTGKGVYQGKKEKMPVMGAVKRGGELRLQAVPNIKTKTIEPFIKANVSPNAQMVVTDEALMYPSLLKNFEHRHQTVCHSKGEYVKFKLIHTNSIESAFSLLKRGFIGSFHKMSQKHLHRYLAEFETRFNNRKNANFFDYVLGQMGSSKPLQYSELTTAGAQ